VIAARDNERQNPMDRITMGQKVCFVAMGRRLVERGVLQSADEVHYLAKHELYDVFLDRRSPDTSPVLLRAKIDSRRRNIDRALAGEIDYPMFLRRNRPLDRADNAGEAGAMRGMGTSPGVVTGTARVVRKLSEAGRVRAGEIMITHHTDPGWTPVFLLLGGVVTETGGLLSHASAVAREYGFPAVQLRAAMSHIPDGATITVNGNTGEIVVHDQPAELARASEMLEPSSG
jgi:pyruvate,water dikinase